MTAIYGDADNGTTAELGIGGETLRAGIRQKEAGREVAYIGKPPETFPATITLDGVELTATRKLGSAVPGFVVLWIPT